MYDIIGDIHGYANTLEALFKKIGYIKKDGIYQHPERKAIFVGDFIDRGPAIRECLQIVKPMVDSGFALAVMGNHEYNAICYHTPAMDGRDWLRERSEKNVKQHHLTLKSFIDYDTEWKDYLEWFKKLPVYLDFGRLRIVHAFWNNEIIDKITDALKGNRLNDSFLFQSTVKNSKQYQWIEDLLKGYELQLPDNIKYTDKDGFVRSEIRVKWWKVSKQETLRSICVKDGHTLPDKSVPSEIIAGIPVYKADEPPVFFGHYWNTGDPLILMNNVCCVDYSIARGGQLVAYRWNGESLLDSANFVTQANVDS